MLKRIKEFEDSKAQGYFSGFWRGKSEEEKDKDERDITVIFSYIFIFRNLKTN